MTTAHVGIDLARGRDRTATGVLVRGRFGDRPFLRTVFELYLTPAVLRRVQHDPRASRLARTLAYGLRHQRRELLGSRRRRHGRRRRR